MGLKTGLIGVWCEGADPATDQHTNGLTLTDFSGTTGTAAGKVGTAGNFETANDNGLAREDEALLSTADINFTIAAWVNPESLSQRHIVAKGSNYYLFFSTSRFRFTIANDAVSVAADTFGLPSVGTWYYVQAQHDATNNLLRIRVNNGAWDEQATGGTAPTGDTEWFSVSGISFPIIPEATWDGLINQAAFWKAVKSDADLNAIYNSGNGLAFSAWDAGAETQPLLFVIT